MRGISDKFGLAAVNKYHQLLPGLGWVERQWRVDALPEYVHLCGLCDGTGKWDHYACSLCDGVGLRHTHTDIPSLSVIQQILEVQRACQAMEQALTA